MYKLGGYFTGVGNRVSNIIDITSFITTWKTDNTGTSTDVQITIPTISSGTYNCDVDWGNGDVETGFTTYNDSRWTHDYGVGNEGAYEVKVSGTTGDWRFENGGDKEKLLEINQWGSFDSNFYRIFYGCINMNILATDVPIFNGNSLDRAFFNCNSLGPTIPNEDFWDRPMNIKTAFNNCSLLNDPNMSKIDTSPTSQFFATFSNCPFDQDTSGWTVENCHDNMLEIRTLSTVNYDIMLIMMRNTIVYTGLSSNNGSNTYTGAAIDSGTTDGTTANKLVDSSQNFGTTISVNDSVHNTTDDIWTFVTAVDSDGILSLNDDIMVSGETYTISSGKAAWARGTLIADFSLSITDGGAA
jgi:hypothetical protein